MGRELKNYALSALGFFITLEAMLVPAILFWPSFRDNTNAIKAMAPIRVLRDMVDELTQGGVAAYVIGQHFFKGCNTIGILAAVVLAAGAVAGEAHRGTLEIWLARPVSRLRLLTERYLLGYLALALPIFLTTATVPWLLGRVEETIDSGALMQCAAYQALFLGLVYSATFLVSVLGHQPVRIAAVMLALAITQFSLYLVKTVTHYTLFRWVDLSVMNHLYSEAVEGSYGWPLGKTALIVIGTLLCYLGAVVAFGRRVP